MGNSTILSSACNVGDFSVLYLHRKIIPFEKIIFFLAYQDAGISAFRPCYAYKIPQKCAKPLRLRAERIGKKFFDVCPD